LAARNVGGPLRFLATPVELPAQPPSTAGPPSLTYEPYYGLKEKPFSLSADPRFLYRSPSRTPAYEELLTGIRRREGLIVLTGEIGTGKTTLIRSVLQQLDRRTFTAFVPDPFVSREDLLKMLLVDFGVVSIGDLKRGSLAGASRPDLSYPLYEFLDSLVPLQAFAVLIIDEAQNLPLPLLEEIRILSELEQREKLLQVVLVGQPELKAHLKLPQMRQVDQRISVRCELSPLGLEDVGGYVRYRLNVASAGESRVEFSDGAIAAVFHGSGGVPRLINLICDRALQRGHAANAAHIESSVVSEAIKGLGLDISTPKARAVPVAEPPRKAKQAADADRVPAREAQIPQPSSVSVRETEARQPTPTLLDFAAESELAGRSRRPTGTWMVAPSLLAAVLVAGCLALWYISVMTATDTGASTLPPSPVWRTANGPAQLPSVDRSAINNALRSSLMTVTEALAAPQNGQYGIQVASFGSRARAERLVTELSSAGFKARAVEVERESSRLLFQVLVGGYATRDDANRDLARIREIPGYGDARLLYN
jgi:general secretion pathway protein A